MRKKERRRNKRKGIKEKEGRLRREGRKEGGKWTISLGGGGWRSLDRVFRILIFVSHH